MKLSIKIVEGFLISCLVFLVFLSSMNSAGGLENIEVIRAFDTDEAKAISWLDQMIAANSVDPQGEFRYPWLQPSIAFWVVKALSLVGYQKDNTFIRAYVYRGISLVSYALLLFFCYKILIAIGLSRIFALACCLVTGTVPIVFEYSSVIHPELLQSCLMVLPFYILTISHSRGYTWLASFVAGAAFGTKYAGFLILPGIWLPFCVCLLTQPSKHWAALAKSIAWFSIAFLAGYLVTNPYMPVNLGKVLLNLRFLRSYMVISGDHSVVDWARIIYKELGIPGTLYLLFGLGALAFGSVQAYKKRSSGLLAALSRSQFALLSASLAVASASGVLGVWLLVTLKSNRYLIEVFPIVMLTGAMGYQYVRRSCPQLVRVFLTVFVVMTGFCMAARTLSSDLILEYSHKYTSGAYRAWAWTKENLPTNARIYSDMYVYLPSSFPNLRTDWYVLVESEQAFAQVDVVVISHKGSGRYVWKKPLTQFKERELDLSQASQTESVLRRLGWFLDNEGPWFLLKEWDDVAIFARKGFKTVSLLEH